MSIYGETTGASVRPQGHPGRVRGKGHRQDQPLEPRKVPLARRDRSVGRRGLAYRVCLCLCEQHVDRDQTELKKFVKFTKPPTRQRTRTILTCVLVLTRRIFWVLGRAYDMVSDALLWSCGCVRGWSTALLRYCITGDERPRVEDVFRMHSHAMS